jgi:hypothetical protein
MTKPKEQQPAPAAEKAQELQQAAERSFWWVPPAVALALIGGIALAYFFGVLGDAQVAMVASLTFAGVLAAVAIKAGFESQSGAFRAATLLCGALLVFAVGYSSAAVLLPGSPDAIGVLREAGATMTVPSPGSYRLQVSASLAAGGEPRIEYRIDGGQAQVAGTIERTYSFARARRGPATRVAQDHDMASHALAVAGEPPTIRLESLRGEGAKGGLTVRAFKVLPPAALWSLIGLMIVLATFLEGRLRRSQSMVVASAVASAVFVSMVEWATPHSAIGPVLGAALLGAGGGVIGGSILGAVGRRLFAAPAPRQPGDDGDGDERPAKREPKQKAA